jgi:hypothetical protein
VKTRSINHRIVGRNDLPDKIWIDSLEDALHLLGKKREAGLFEKMIDYTERECPVLLGYLERHPHSAVGLAADWEKLVEVALWVMSHPRPEVYLRQIDLKGVHTKFIEQHKGTLAQMLDSLLPKEAVSQEARTSEFEARYGFRREPVLIRFRPNLECKTFPSSISDISIPSDEFAALDLMLEKNFRVLVVENHINFLSIPRAKNFIIIWGSGYGFDSLKTADWLKDGIIYYWGDIDTHGFAILNQFRTLFPEAKSILMEKEILMSHKDLWVDEPKPARSELSNLTSEESALYLDLRENVFGQNVRLEQERIGYGAVLRAMRKITNDRDVE